MAFGKTSAVVVERASGVPVRLRPDRRRQGSARERLRRRRSSVASSSRWQPAPGATKYEIQWSRTKNPWKRAGRTITPATAAKLNLSPDVWYYRVRGHRHVDRRASPQGMTWSDPQRYHASIRAASASASHRLAGQLDRDAASTGCRTRFLVARRSTAWKTSSSSERRSLAVRVSTRSGSAASAVDLDELDLARGLVLELDLAGRGARSSQPARRQRVRLRAGDPDRRRVLRRQARAPRPPRATDALAPRRCPRRPRRRARPGAPRTRTARSGHSRRVHDEPVDDRDRARARPRSYRAGRASAGRPADRRRRSGTTTLAGQAARLAEQRIVDDLPAHLSGRRRRRRSTGDRPRPRSRRGRSPARGRGGSCATDGARRDRRACPAPASPSAPAPRRHGSSSSSEARASRPGLLLARAVAISRSIARTDASSLNAASTSARRGA